MTHFRFFIMSFVFFIFSCSALSFAAGADPSQPPHKHPIEQPIATQFEPRVEGLPTVTHYSFDPNGRYETIELIKGIVDTLPDSTLVALLGWPSQIKYSHKRAIKAVRRLFPEASTGRQWLRVKPLREWLHKTPLAEFIYEHYRGTFTLLRWGASGIAILVALHTKHGDFEHSVLAAALAALIPAALQWYNDGYQAWLAGGKSIEEFSIQNALQWFWQSDHFIARFIFRSTLVVNGPYYGVKQLLTGAFVDQTVFESAAKFMSPVISSALQAVAAQAPWSILVQESINEQEVKLDLYREFERSRNVITPEFAADYRRSLQFMKAFLSLGISAIGTYMAMAAMEEGNGWGYASYGLMAAGAIGMIKLSQIDGRINTKAKILQALRVHQREKLGCASLLGEEDPSTVITIDRMHPKVNSSRTNDVSSSEHF